MNELEVARYFIAMLYLSMKNKIEIITQATEYEDNGPSEDTFSNNASEKTISLTPILSL